MWQTHEIKTPNKQTNRERIENNRLMQMCRNGGQSSVCHATFGSMSSQATVFISIYSAIHQQTETDERCSMAHE